MTIIDTIIATARQQIGKPYVFGSDGPTTFDCSGLISYAFGLAGISLPHNAAQQQRSSKVTKISAAAARPGDLVFYGNPAHHVALYVGNGKQIAAPHSGTVVKEQGVSSGATYGRVSGTGVASNPAAGALINLASTTGSTVQNASFSLDGWMGQVKGVTLQVTAVTFGLALVVGGLVVATRKQRQSITKKIDDTGDAISGAII